MRQDQAAAGPSLPQVSPALLCAATAILHLSCLLLSISRLSCSLLGGAGSEWVAPSGHILQESGFEQLPLGEFCNHISANILINYV